MCKICKKCKIEVPLVRFPKDKRNTDGHTAICKQCCSTSYNKENRYFNKDGLLKCRECKVYMDISNFYPDPTQKYRKFKAQDCKQCQSTNGRLKRLKALPDSITKVLASVYNAMNTRSTHNHELSREYLMELYHKQKGRCAISGIPMEAKRGKGRHHLNVSIDQIIAGQGYTKDNVQLVCNQVNMMKGAVTLETLVHLCKSIAEYQYEKFS